MSDPFRDKCAIVGVGYTPFTRASGVTPTTLAIDAISAALDDAGLTPDAIDGLATYAVRNDSASPSEIAQVFRIADRMSYYLNVSGGGSLSHTIVAEAAMACIVGMADYVVCYRALNGRSGLRMGATGRAPTVGGEDQYFVPHGLTAPGQRYAMAARAHMMKYGTTSEQLGAIAVNQRRNASMNDRAMMRTPITIDDYLASPWIAEPFHRLDYCQENDGACAVIVTTAERARDLAQRPVNILSAVWGPGHLLTSSDWPDMTESGPKYGAPRLFARAGVTVADLDVAALYDCFSYTALVQLEGYGLCAKGDGGPFAASGAIALDGSIPVNTHGGNLSEGYIQGLNTLCEAVLQLRGTVGPRQVPGAELALSTGADGMITGHSSALILRAA